ncbi:terminase large subunit domain-containing protein [Salinicola rhizosphaerae]|uniref:Bacteriophage terminase ATPase subunit n=1 Tax=Salinicola rhizosphaerae TaxID=1443141 RepID=A0ABQ3EFX4_9GAMM|nr:terminase family protein [Salinicola rhizosphaerae]GHB32805.1 bacteriophage terminase ATPase subunit [Salinicola rhizosphaerae]
MTTTAPDTLDSPRLTARHLYWQGWRVARIAEFLETKAATVHSWKDRDGWEEASPTQRVEGALEARLVQLIGMARKGNGEYKEIDALGRMIERLARVHRYQETGREGDLNPNLAARNAGEKRKPKRNALTEDQLEALEAAFLESLFEYQRQWLNAGEKHRIRNILKSRQIGATFYFAREAIVDAFKTGKNKIFLSASKAQAHIFKNYIIQFVKETCDVELKGDPIILDNGAELHFLGTNSKTAQGYHGDVYLDEYFWIHGFEQFRKVASAMATHKQWRQTYFSTPSSIAHEAYTFWTGERINKRRKKADRVDIDVSHAALAAGALCGDRQWKQIVTVHDAEAGGCDLFDVEDLQFEYSADEFANLFECVFVDDSQSAFPLGVMQGCMVDAWEEWESVYRPYAPRPVGNRGVWIGYDPTGRNEDGDGAGLVVVLPAQAAGEKHRILERHRLKGQDYEEQAAFIRKFADKYDIDHIGIDTTGIGAAVAEHVEKWFPLVTRYHYTVELKTQMVLQAQQIIRKDRLEFDAGWVDLAQSFMAIKKQLTASGRQFTYVSGRNAQTGHADLAWATMHALHFEPIDGPAGETSESIMEMYE